MLRQYDATYVEVSRWGSTDQEPPSMLYKQRMGKLALMASNDKLFLYDEFFDKLLAEEYDSYEQFTKKAEKLQEVVQYQPITDFTAEEFNEYFKHITSRIIQANEIAKNLQLIDEVNECNSKN